jgi:HEAT repeat protein
VLATRIALALALAFGATAPTRADDKKIATEADIEMHLAKAAVGQKGDRASHVAWFMTVYPPNDKVKARVARKLIEFTEDNTNAVVRGRAGAALPNWATEEIGPKLIDLINGTGPTEKEGAIIACGRIKYEKAIPRLVQEVETGNRSDLAVKALIEIGPACEEKVIPLLEKKIHAVNGAIRILDKVGTSKSIPALEKVAKSFNNATVQTRAKGVIEGIQEREKEAKK